MQSIAWHTVQFKEFSSLNTSESNFVASSFFYNFHRNVSYGMASVVDVLGIFSCYIPYRKCAAGPATGKWNVFALVLVQILDCILTPYFLAHEFYEDRSQIKKILRKTHPKTVSYFFGAPQNDNRNALVHSSEFLSQIRPPTKFSTHYVVPLCLDRVHGMFPGLA